MSGIAVFAFAYNSNGERIASCHTPPEILKYIDHTEPEQVAPYGYSNEGREYLIDTTHNNVTIFPVKQVLVPQGQRLVEAPFASWVIEYRTGTLLSYSRPVREFAKGEYGWVVLNFGVTVEQPWPHIPPHMQDFDVLHPEPWIPIVLARQALPRQLAKKELLEV
jgi:hypothetical protein